MQNVSLRPRQVRLLKPRTTNWTVSGCPAGGFLLVPGQSYDVQVRQLHMARQCERYFVSLLVPGTRPERLAPIDLATSCDCRCGTVQTILLFPSMMRFR